MDIAKSETFKNFVILNKALLFLIKLIKIGLRGTWTYCNNLLNSKIAELDMLILHSRPSKSYRTKDNTTSRDDSLCFRNILV